MAAMVIKAHRVGKALAYVATRAYKDIKAAQGHKAGRESAISASMACKAHKA